MVAGQIPAGWEAGRYGIPEDIIAQTDRITLWALVFSAEALNASGITDPYELYKYMHPSNIGACIGGELGDGRCDEHGSRTVEMKTYLKNDILQET